jgi:glyoxylase-like metal-dependent hydrolase (beta-lactamase superfamily II)
VRAVAVQPDVLVVTSRMWQTTATAIRAPGDGEDRDAEAFLIDSPYFPDELELLPALLSQSGFAPRGLLATHADFDHLLGRLAFPDLTLGVGEPTMARIRSEPGAAQRELRDADADHYVRRDRPLSLGGVQALPVPGHVRLGPGELDVHPADGHTADGIAIFWRASGVLVCGDYLSDVEIPILSPGGSLGAYRSTLARLASLAEAAAVVVPGHGRPHERDRALAILDEDLAYLDAVEAGDERPPLPPGRDSRRQRAIHAENLRASG